MALKRAHRRSSCHSQQRKWILSLSRNKLSLICGHLSWSHGRELIRAVPDTDSLLKVTHVLSAKMGNIKPIIKILCTQQQPQVNLPEAAEEVHTDGRGGGWWEWKGWIGRLHWQFWWLGEVLLPCLQGPHVGKLPQDAGAVTKGHCPVVLVYKWPAQFQAARSSNIYRVNSVSSQLSRFCSSYSQLLSRPTL